MTPPTLEADAAGAPPAAVLDAAAAVRARLGSVYDFEPHWTPTPEGAWLHRVDEGASHADPILCVHGNPSWSFHYRAVVRRFRATHRVVAPDLIGCGLSEKPRGWGYRLRHHVDTLEDLVERLDLQRITLVVQDWGGAIGLGVAGRQPDRFARLVILNSGAFRSTAMPPRIALGRIPLLGTLGIRGLGLFSRLALPWAVERKRWSAQERAGYLAPHSSWAERVAVDAFVKDIPMSESHPSWDELVRIEEGLAKLRSTPATLIWGERDWCFTTEFRDRYRQLLPGAESIGLPDAGHWVLEDAPEQVLDGIAGLIERAPLS